MTDIKQLLLDAAASIKHLAGTVESETGYGQTEMFMLADNLEAAAASMGEPVAWASMIDGNIVPAHLTTDRGWLAEHLGKRPSSATSAQLAPLYLAPPPPAVPDGHKMKLDFTKSWCESMARLEGEEEVGAGSEGCVTMPQSVDEARAMALLGMEWLRANAPEELKSVAQDSESVARWLDDHDMLEEAEKVRGIYHG